MVEQTASPDHVLAWYAAGTAHGGTGIESPPAERPNGSFVAYLRDPDGNKLTASLSQRGNVRASGRAIDTRSYGTPPKSSVC